MYCSLSNPVFYASSSHVVSSPCWPSTVLHPPDRSQDPAWSASSSLPLSAVLGRACWHARASMSETQTHECIHAVCQLSGLHRAPLEEKHQLSAERDLVNQAPSSQWCSQTCINVRAEAEEERWTWRRSCGCKCIWWEKMDAAIPLTSMNNNLIRCYIFARLMWLISNTFTHTDSKQLFIRVLVKVEHPSNYGCLLVCKNNERLKQGKIPTVWNEMDGLWKTVAWGKVHIRLSEHAE